MDFIGYVAKDPVHGRGKCVTSLIMHTKNCDDLYQFTLVQCWRPLPYVHSLSLFHTCTHPPPLFPSPFPSLPLTHTHPPPLFPSPFPSLSSCTHPPSPLSPFTHTQCLSSLTHNTCTHSLSCFWVSWEFPVRLDNHWSGFWASLQALSQDASSQRTPRRSRRHVSSAVIRLNRKIVKNWPSDIKFTSVAM